MALRFLLQLTRDPGALWTREERIHAGLVGRKRPVVQVRRVLQMPRIAGGIELDVEHALRDDTALARTGKARILNAVLQVEEHAWVRASIALIDQHRTTAQQIAVAFQREIDGGVEQRVAWADECSERLALRGNERLLEGDAFVAR